MSVPISNSPSIADWLTAIGTVGAVIVALLIAFLGTMQRKYRKPVLKIEFENREPFCRHTEIIGVTHPNPHGYFLRLRVRNTGKSMARDCEGKLIRIIDVATGQPRTDFDPSNLHWAGHGLNQAISIHKTAYEYLDVIYVRDDTPEIFPFTLQMEPRGFSLVFPRADYILDIVLFGKNTEPVENHFRVHINASFALGYDQVTLEESNL